MKPLHVLLAALAASLASCATPTGIVAPDVFTLEQAADSIPVAYGKTVTVDRMLLRFADVPEDSRCPTRVACVSAGDATVSAGVTLTCTRSEPACAVPELQLNLHTNVEPRAGVYAGLAIRLVTLMPVPDVPVPIRKDRYVAWFRILPVTN
jgi:hypothetical protein